MKLSQGGGIYWRAPYVYCSSRTRKNNIKINIRITRGARRKQAISHTYTRGDNAGRRTEGGTMRRRGALFSNTKRSRGGKLERRWTSKAASGGSFHNKKKNRTVGHAGAGAKSHNLAGKRGQLTRILTYYKKKGTRRVEGEKLLATGKIQYIARLMVIFPPRCRRGYCRLRCYCGSLGIAASPAVTGGVMLLSLATRYLSLMADQFALKKGRFFSSVLRSLSLTFTH